jgi:hypothetical protein
MVKQALGRLVASDISTRVSHHAGIEDPMHVLCLVDGLATAEVGRTCVLLWRGVVNETRFQLQREAMEHVTSRYPGEASILCVIEPTSEPPPQQLRDAATNLLVELGPKLRCVAYVIEGTGFRAAMIRGVLSGIELVRRNKTYPARYFATVGQASAWIAVETGRKSLELSEACHRLRGRMDSVDEQRAPRSSGTAAWPTR